MLRSATAVTASLMLAAGVLAACGDSGSSSSTTSATVPTSRLGTAAPAIDPATGRYGPGGGVSFLVLHSGHATPMIEEARFNAVSRFEPATVHAGAFQTCGHQRINSVLFRDYCMRGRFTSSDAASGTVAVYQGAHGQRASHPSETHEWSASRG